MAGLEKETIRKVLEQAGLPPFQLDRNGFPLPGPVVKYYRQRMTYIGRDGHEKHWSQIDLAQRLGVSTHMVKFMENQNKGLDSIERRRTLAALLHIPPVLLGLASFDQLMAMLVDKPTSTNSNKSGGLGKDDLQFYKDALHVYKTAYEEGSLQATMQTLEALINRLEQAVSHVSRQQTPLLDLLWQYRMLAANSYIQDALAVKNATKHLNHVNRIALHLKNEELQTVVKYRSGEMYIMAGNMKSAKTELDAALTLSKSASLPIQGRVLSYTALINAMTETDTASSLSIQRLLDKAERCASPSDSLLKFDNIKYLENRADTLITLSRYDRALETLDVIEDVSISRRRTLQYTNLLRAECLIKQKRPDYDLATMLLRDVLEQNKSEPIKYYVEYVERLYTLLQATSYGNSPEVADIGLMLRELRGR